MEKIQTRITEGTYLLNNPAQPIRYGQIEIYNAPTKVTRTSKTLEGILCKTVITGFCGSDYALMRMGKKNNLSNKFPSNLDRLINGHEGIVYVPEKKKYAIVLIRGGNAKDPSRYTDDEDYFEYGCDRKDGLMSKEGFYNPEMLLYIPENILPKGKKIPLKLAKRLIFCDPYACVRFFKERAIELIPAHNYRLYLDKSVDEDKAREIALEKGFSKIVIFGCGGTGLLSAHIFNEERKSKIKIVVVARSSETTPKIQFLKKYFNVDYVQNKGNETQLVKDITDKLGGKATYFFAASGNEIESKIAFDYGLLSNNGIYASFTVGTKISFDTLEFGFKNQLIYGDINFRRDHMEEALNKLPFLPFDEVVKIYDIKELKNDPVKFYEKVFKQEREIVKGAVLWNEDLIED